MSSTALRLLQQLVKESESNLSEYDEDRVCVRRCWNVETRIHCERTRVVRNIRQAHMNPASLQKPASIKDFCDINVFSPTCRHASCVQIFSLSSCARVGRRAGFEAQNFFSQAGPGSACEGRFKFGFERIGATLIRMREIPDRVCVRRRRVEEGAVSRFACRVIAPGTGATSDAD